MSPIGSFRQYQQYTEEPSTSGLANSELSGRSLLLPKPAGLSSDSKTCHQMTHTTSPLSDSLLLALRRSRPNTRLFRALFQYIPLRDSPNENPHLELPLQTGDYILVHGQMDEDQFYFGETLNGRTGLVPSNYVERVPDHILLQNASRAPSPVNMSGSLTNLSCAPSTSNLGCVGNSTATISAGGTVPPGFYPTNEQPCQKINISGSSGPIIASSSLQRPGSPSFALNVPSHHSMITHDFTDSELAPLPDSVCPYPPVDVSKVTVQEVKLNDQPKIPFPREITVEKKLSRSVVISWLPPEDKLVAVSQYHVCAEGVVKAVVPGTYKCKALIEDLPLDKSVNISVRAVTEHGHSPDAACTISIGLEAPVAPQHVRVSSISPISAQLSWYPSNSNAEHVILLNAIKVGVCPPAVFRVQLQGLSPSTIYRVSVRTKHPKAVLEQQPVERCVDFKTLPKIGLPDPPGSVQVEVGPQPGTLLVSWKPVVSQPRPPSRAAVHSYLIFADGRNIAQVPSATADHVLLRLADFADDPPIFITVRTRTREGTISADSNVVRVPRGGSGINSNFFLEKIQLPYSSIAINTATPGPLATASLPNSLIGRKVPAHIPPQDYLQPSIKASSLPYGAAQNPPLGASGLLTTLPPHQDLTMSTGQYDLRQVYPQGFQMNQPGIMSMSQPSTSNLYPQIPQVSQLNVLNGVTANPKMPEWALQQSVQPQVSQQTSQYYTFHPKTLYKEFTGADDKPSVLEMENNYLLKHRQQQRERELYGWPGVGVTSTLNRYDYYGRNGRNDDLMGNFGNRALLPPTRKLTAIPPRLTRVRSEELLGTRSEPDLRPLTIADPRPLGMAEEDERCRWFVALFDYDHLMSPNPNAQQEELSFRKHQLIKVFGDVDQDGFYRGQIGRRFGLVPSNMVIEIAKEDLMTQRRRSDAVPVEPAIRRMRWGSFKSRSYDHAGDTRRRRGNVPPVSYPQNYGRTGPTVMPGAPLYSSLDRREYSLPPYLRQYDRPEPTYPSGRGYGISAGRTYGAHGYPVSARDYPKRDIPYDQGPGYDPYEGPSRDYRRTISDEYPGRDPYHWDYPPEPKDHREFKDERDYRYDHPPYEDERYPPAQRSALRRDYQRYPDQSQWNSNIPPEQYETPIQLQQQQQQQPPQTQTISVPPVRYGQQQQMMPQDDRLKLNGENPQVRKMIAKYDYDPKHCSPNVDAEQVELTFHQGDIITVYGDMDEDGFYVGELNGVRGMVPSNFLQTPQAAQQPQSIIAGGGVPMEAPVQRPKGVVFSDNTKKPTPVRQSSQTSTKTGTGGMTSATGAAGSTSGMAAKATKPAAGGAAGKTLTKKASDLGTKGNAANVARKSSQAAKKVDVKKK
ncbi:hypothetical protein FO519_004043 [Halicephalobus sp. NKZ332]|nr:hypothetical protein FO519_004043 [Halicephalobus sp. NKZ332]